jgi:hypothetical protein
VTNALLGGWSLSPILSAASGAPLELSVNGNPNQNGKLRFGRSGEFVSEHAQLSERYTFDPNGRFNYQGTYNDPTVMTRPFTITIPNKRVTLDTPQDDWNNQTFDAKHAGKERIIGLYEQVCVEGNEGHGEAAETPQ